MEKRKKALQQIGILIFSITLCFIPATLLEIKKAYVDFSCVSALGGNSAFSGEVGTYYCISYWPRSVMGGGSVYASGIIRDDEVVIISGKHGIPDIYIKKEGGRFVINDIPVDKGKGYSNFFVTLSWNPWYFYSTKIEIYVNYDFRGKVKIDGDIREGRIPNPLGILLLGVGLWLWQGGKEKSATHKRGAGEGV